MAASEPETLRLRLAAKPMQAHLLRAHLRIWLSEQGAEEAELHDVLVAANEAFANAIVHAGQPRSIAIQVEASINEGVVEVVVCDHGHWQESRHYRGVGLGLALMHALMDTVELHATLTGTTVRLRRLLATHAGREQAVPAPAHDRIELLRRSPIFASLPDPAIHHLAEQLIPFSASAEETIIREGDSGELFYLVGDGQLEVTVQGRHVATLATGDSAGEIALLRADQRTATIVSKEPVRLYALTREDFLAVVNAHPESRRAAESILATRLVELQDVLGRTA